MRDSILTKKLFAEIADIHQFTDELPYEEYATNIMGQKAVVMSIINIGELSEVHENEAPRGCPCGHLHCRLTSFVPGTANQFAKNT